MPSLAVVAMIAPSRTMSTRLLAAPDQARSATWKPRTFEPVAVSAIAGATEVVPLIVFDQAEGPALLVARSR